MNCAYYILSQPYCLSLISPELLFSFGVAVSYCDSSSAPVIGTLIDETTDLGIRLFARRVKVGRFWVA